MYILSFGTMIKKVFRLIFFFLDSVIYNLIPKIYDLLITIARTSPLSQASITDMASRIYKLLAVFMIFKVTFSLIMYVVNPDDFSDKNKGVSKLVTNIVISLGLLVLTPYFFSYGFQLQKIILEDNSLATLVFGDDAANTNNILNDAGNSMAYIAISPFISPNLELFDCTKLYDAVEDEIILNKSCFGFEDLVKYDEDNTCDGAEAICDHLCKNDCDNNLTKEDLLTYAAGIKSGNFNLMFRQEIISTVDTKNGEKFMFDYTFLISTVVGVVILLLLITMCMDIALRSIKLAFLQLIAPIPILSYIDPKSGKDGMFKKWGQMCIKTYLTLFIKLLVIYFAIYIIGNIGWGKMVDIIDGSYITNALVKIFIIIGALMFAKEFTKILESLGVKLDGGFQLNPIKKFEEQALGGKRITGAAASTAVGALGGLSLTGRNIANNWKQGKAEGHGLLRRTSRALFRDGLLGGVGNIGFEGIKGGAGGAIHNEGFTKGWKSQVASNRKFRSALDNGSTFLGRRLENIADITGMTGFGTSEAIEAQIHQVDEEIKKNQNDIKNYELERDAAKARFKETQRTNDVIKKSFGDLKDTAIQKMKDGKGDVGAHYTANLDTLEAIKNQIGNTTTFTYYDSTGTARTVTKQIDTNDVTALSSLVRTYEQDGWKDLLTEVLSGHTTDAKLQTKIDVATSDYQNMTGNVFANDVHNGTDVDSILGASVGASARAEAEQRTYDEMYYNQIKNLNDDNEALEEQKRQYYEAQKARKANKDAVSGK